LKIDPFSAALELVLDEDEGVIAYVEWNEGLTPRFYYD
jgi:hypothetical protein